ncbi:MAG TPA: DUF2953 domain-containing protein [Desulfobacteria bacterium]|nr:DUF2953 domain-containing protein [Desulfobacteria bacterium]
MTGIIIYLAILSVVFFMTMFLRVRFDVGYRRDGEDDHLKVEMTLLRRLISYKTEIPVVELDKFFLDPVLKVEADIEGVVSDPIADKGMIIKVPIIKIIRKLPMFIKSGMHYLKRYQEVLYGLLKSIRCYQLKWITQIGLEDPADTGMIIGLIWSVKGFMYRVFQSNVGSMEQKPEFCVIPNFGSSCLKLDFHCIFDMRIGHIIIAGLKFVKLRLKP